MRKILTFLYILQEKKNEKGFIRHRLNPYNPLSYLFLVTQLISGLIYYGIKGFSEEMDMRGKKNPFKWQ